MGIVTSRSRAEYEEDFTRLGLYGYFDTVVCEEDTVNHKPEAEPLDFYMRKTGARPEEVLYIETAFTIWNAPARQRPPAAWHCGGPAA